MTSAPKLVYLINGFARGGAEQGLLHMVRHGAFAGLDLHLVSLVGGDAKLIGDFAAAGAPPRILMGDAKMGASAWLKGGFAFRQLLKELRPRMVALSLPQANIAGRLAAGAEVETVIAFEHNSTLARPIYTKAYRWTAGRVDVAFADCEATLSAALAAHYPRRPRTTRIVPLVSFDAPPPILAPPTSAHFVTAGRLTPVKNHIAMVRAVGLVRDRGKMIALTIFGEGALRTALEAEIARLGLGDRVRLAGFGDWLGSGPYTGFVLSSLHEGLCIVVLEAMWRGFPAVAPLVGGLADYADDGTSVIVADASPEALAGGMERLAEDHALRARLAEAGQARALARYGRAAVRESYARLAGELCSGFG
jgi:glycosyltransferase involved in cell wall biosynthesis